MIHYNLYQFDLIKIKKDFERAKCTCVKSSNKYGYKKLNTYNFSLNKDKIANAYSYGNIEKKKGANDFCVQFDPKQKEIINIVDNNGYLTVYQFDRKEKGDKLKLVKNAFLFGEES